MFTFSRRLAITALGCAAFPLAGCHPKDADTGASAPEVASVVDTADERPDVDSRVTSLTVTVDGARVVDGETTMVCPQRLTSTDSTPGNCPDCEWSFVFELQDDSPDVTDCVTTGIGFGAGPIGIGGGEYGSYGSVMFVGIDGEWRPFASIPMERSGSEFYASFSMTSGYYGYAYTYDMTFSGTLYDD